MKLLRKIRALFRKEKLDAEMAEEMRAHLELQTAQNISRGMSADDAHYAARREFGGVEQIKERARDQRGGMWLEQFLQDLRYGVRQLRKAPGFTAVAVLTLALGIGANTAILSLINGIMFRPVMSRNPEQLVGVYQHDRDNADRFRFFSYLDYADLRGDNETFTDLFAFSFAALGVREGDVTRKVTACFVTANYFSALGVPPALGRGFLPEEETNETPVVVLSHAFWKGLGSDPAFVGQKLKLTRGDVTVVGVMPRDFSGALLTAPAFFLPVAMADAFTPNPRVLRDRSDRRLMLMGRLKPGLTLDDAGGALLALNQRFAVPDPETPKARTLLLTPPARFEAGARPGGGTQRMAPLAALALGLSLLVLFIACVNLANMLLARGASRRKEIAVRLALGARRSRVFRQLLTEGLLLALLGGAGGLLVSAVGTSLLATFLSGVPSADLPQFNFSPDGRVLVSLLVLSVLATVFFALGPAWKLARSGANLDLKTHAGEDARDSRRGRFSTCDILAVGQMALALALLVAAALFSRSAMNAVHANLGFEFGSHFYVSLDAALTGDPEPRLRSMIRDATERLAALPGVESVSPAMSMPFGESIRHVRVVQVAGAPPPTQAATTFAEGKVSLAYYNSVGADYFRTLGLPLLRGREFERREADGSAGARVVILSQNFAEQLWPGEDPLGRSIQFPGGKKDAPPTVATVVGITPDIQWDIMSKESQAWIYLPLGQEFQADVKLHVRVASGAAAASLMSAARAELRRLDPRIAPKEIKTLAALHRDGPVRLFQLGSMLFSAFGALAILLSFLGIYGLKAYAVARRTREIGIRMALGANASGVIAMILRESAWLAGLGLGLGLLLALAVGKLTAGFLYQVAAFDLATFLVIPPLLLGVVLVACWLPARRAAKVDPLVALRCE